MILSTVRVAVGGIVMVAVLAACSTTVVGQSLGPVSESSGTSGPSKASSAPASTSNSSGSSGSSGKAVAAGPDGAPHPCALLIQSEAETLAGTPLEAGTESGEGDDKTLCQYVGPATGPLAQVQLLVGDGAKKALDIDRDILQHSFTTSSGVGDEAYAEDDTVFLRKGDTWVSVGLARLNEPAENADRLKAAAGEIAARLG
jgi:hypothetical protein